MPRQLHDVSKSGPHELMQFIYPLFLGRLHGRNLVCLALNTSKYQDRDKMATICNSRFEMSRITLKGVPSTSINKKLELVLIMARH